MRWEEEYAETMVNARAKELVYKINVREITAAILRLTRESVPLMKVKMVGELGDVRIAMNAREIECALSILGV